MPEIIEQPERIRARVTDWQRAGQRVGFVPTMGNLHAGHIALVEEAKRRADRVVVSLYVNPTQFSAGEDFDSYPRSLDADCARLEGEGVDAVFAPGDAQMYPGGRENTTIVEVPDLAHILCGEHRPGHFTGVSTVVARLFNRVPADIAVFGEKDFQQLMIIRRMVFELGFPIQIIGVPTVREADGLAMSSRNQYLGADERARAPVIHAAMKTVREAVLAGGFRSDADRLRLEEEGAARLADAGLECEYFSLRNAADLGIARPDDRSLRVLVAARLGAARLIDNLRIR